MKSKIIYAVLWASFILAMAASIQHLAWTFGTVEQPGREWLGWIPAVAVDAGLAALAYTIQQRKKAKRPTAVLWGGVAGFALVSALANFYHALAVEGVVLEQLIAKAILLSATLPAMYIFLGEIISGDDASEAERIAKHAEDEQAKARQEQERADRKAKREDMQAERELIEAKRLLLETERQQTQIQPEQTQSETAAVLCEDCGRSFLTVNARNAHKCKHAPEKVNGVAK